MKKSIIACFALVLLSCSVSEKNPSITVLYPEFDLASLLSSDLFSNVEIIPLHGESAPIMTSLGSDLIVQNNLYYFLPFALQKVCLFDQSGKYLNSIGSIGRGPGEYLQMRSVMLEENGDISIYGYGTTKTTLYTYTPQGAFVDQTAISSSLPTMFFAASNGYRYHFGGHGHGTVHHKRFTEMERIQTPQTAHPERGAAGWKNMDFKRIRKAVL